MPNNVATGIPGLDELISGGFPRGRTILVVGGPGTGKTILAGQFLYNGIYEHNEHGAFVSLDESKDHFYSEMKQFGWDFKKAEEEGKFVFIDATRMSRVSMLKEKLYSEETKSLRGKQLPIDMLIEELQAKITLFGVKRIAVDTLAALFYRFVDHTERRNAVVDLIESLSDLKATTIVTTELGTVSSLERSALEEEYLVHGVIMMQTLFSEGTTTRAVQVEKMRGVQVNPAIVPYTIDKNGIEVFPKMALFGGR